MSATHIGMTSNPFSGGSGAKPGYLPIPSKMKIPF